MTYITNCHYFVINFKTFISFVTYEKQKIFEKVLKQHAIEAYRKLELIYV